VPRPFIGVLPGRRRPFSPVERAHVEIAVLGPLSFRGFAAAFARPAARDLVAYLALHREGVSHDQWSLALWPDRTVSPATIHSTASDARRGLGADPLGRPRLPRGRSLRLSDDVTTDVERFARLASDRDPDRLCRALALVRGPLLTGLRRADWAVFDGTQAALESLVVHTALRASLALVAAGRPDRAAWALRRALVVSPYDERLYRALLEATAAQGNRVALGSTMAELLARAGEAQSSLGLHSPPGRESSLVSVLHPDTTALYCELVGRRPATGGSPARL
jgi:DNA-binding SARP family transcriptional activator